VTVERDPVARLPIFVSHICLNDYYLPRTINKFSSSERYAMNIEKYTVLKIEGTCHGLSLGIDCTRVDKWHVPKKHRTTQRKEDNPIVGVPSNIWNSCVCIVYFLPGRQPKVHSPHASVAPSAAPRRCVNAIVAYTELSSNEAIGAKQRTLGSLHRLQWYFLSCGTLGFESRLGRPRNCVSRTRAGINFGGRRVN
jgi:hypothetical protein